MTKKQLNRLADSRLCTIFANENPIVAACAVMAVFDHSDFVKHLASGRVTVVLVMNDILHVSYMPGDLTKLPFATVHTDTY